ncbi:chorismate-binding protein, partial [Thiomonas sp.]
LPLAHAPVTPLVEGLSFAQATMLDGGDAVDAWLVRQLAALGGADAPAGLAGWRRGITEAGYGAALARIAAYLAAGDTYQIDYTFPLHARAFGHPLALYRALRQRQPTAYRCLAYLGGDGATPGNLGGPSLHPSQPSRPVRASGRWVLSLSPEQFFTLQPGGHIAARPMKGTAPRQADPIQDAQAAAWLGADPKNRAENLMILDLLRNDLGRIAKPGSVRVPRRFSVEPYAQVWQMTSSVSAELAPATGWRELWAALFPCGSVVGAPKHRSMQIIGELEPQARGLYTGAMGWVAPVANSPSLPPPPGGGGREGIGPPSQVQAVFSVAIRTLEIDDRLRRGTRAARLGLGSGVVADSDPVGEWAECLLKARFATALDPGFGLIETFAARRDAPGGSQNAEQINAHLQRLAKSARYFGFRLDLRALRDAIAAAHAKLPATPHRTRIELRHDGSCHLSTAPLADLPRHEGRVQVLLAETLLDHAAFDPDDLFLRHKTTHRARYDAAWKAAEAQGAFDALFFNTRGELCEGGRSSVFVKLDGRWFTPPLRCGLLPGVARAALLTNATLGAAERIITRADLLAAEDLLLANALRGALPAQLEVGPPSLPRPQHPLHLTPLARETNGSPD